MDHFTEGQKYRDTFKFDSKVVDAFATFSGDTNSLHMMESEAQSYGYSRRVAHGAILVAFVSRMIGMQIPGPGAVWMGHSVEWLLPVYVDDEVVLEIEVNSYSPAARVLELHIQALNQRNEEVMKGIAKVKVAHRISMNRSQPKDVKEMVAVVTGGSRGIGAEIARKLGSIGMQVVVGYHSSTSDAEQVAETIRENGVSATAIQVNLEDCQSTEAFVGDALDQLNRIDVVVHAATPPITSKPIIEQDHEGFRRFFDFYVGGTHTLISAAILQMKERSFGRLILLGTSILDSTPPSGWASYITAKQALLGYVKCAAVELGPWGITCNMVSPGMTVTDLTSDISPRIKEVEAQKNPMRRLASKQDTANLVSFLAGLDSSYINGANLPVCGGPL